MEPQPNRRRGRGRGRAPQQVQGRGPVVQGDAPVPQQQVQGGGPLPEQHLQGDAPLPQQHLQGGGPVAQQHLQGGGPVAQQVTPSIPAELQFKAYEFMRFEPKYLKLPKRAPAVEGTRFIFERKKHTTGSTIGDLIKMKTYHRSEKVADKRRHMLYVLPENKKNAEHLKKLGDELKGLMDSLDEALAELRAVVPTEGNRPKHFNQPPALMK